jgi:uncharacterized protein YhaN
MRALDGALFGIPRRTRDTHTHPGPALKINLSLETHDGQTLRVQRLKRDGQSLFAADGSPVDEAILREALGGLPPEEFRAMFLLDCDKLEEGSEDLLAGRGLLGQALFGAALGFGRVHSVLANLDEEAQTLWIKGGNRAVTQQIKVLTDARRHKRQDRLDPDDLARLHRELNQTEEQLVDLKETQGKVTRRLERTIRHQRCLPHLAQRAQLLEQLEHLPATPQLPASFADDVRAADGDFAAATRLITETDEELNRVNAELDANPSPGRLPITRPRWTAFTSALARARRPRVIYLAERLNSLLALANSSASWREPAWHSTPTASISSASATQTGPAWRNSPATVLLSTRPARAGSSPSRG